MKRNNVLVTPFNYRQLYAPLNPTEDILEEVYLALGENADIDKYMERACSMGVDGAMWLNQVRHCVKNGMPEELYGIDSPVVLVRLREIADRLSNNELKRVFVPLVAEGYSETKWKYLLGWYLDFDKRTYEDSIALLKYLRDDDLLSVDAAIRRGYPVFDIFKQGKQVSHDRLLISIKLMSQNKWKPCYSDENWKYDTLGVFTRLSMNMYTTLLECNPSPYNSVENVSGAIRCLREGLPVRTVRELLTVENKRDLYPAWMFGKMIVLTSEGIPTEKFLNPELSREDVDRMERIYKYESESPVGGSFFPRRN